MIDDREKAIIEKINHPLYTVEFLEEWTQRDDNVFVNAPAAIQAMGAKGFMAAVKYLARAEQNEEGKKIRCHSCYNFQPYEPAAGLLEGCTAPVLYADEDGQEIIPEMNDIITEYMRNSGEGCPYFEGEEGVDGK